MRKNRFLALLLTLCMVFSLVPSSAFAADNTGAKASEISSIIAFSSDVHNKSDYKSSDRLGTWLEMVKTKYGTYPESMGFGGDMANASASASDYWSLAAVAVNQVTSRNINLCYTTGNHEYSPGNYSANSTNATQQLIKINKEGYAGDDYLIYCLGSASSSQNYTADQITALSNYLEGKKNDTRPVIIITHFPLHSIGGSSSWWGGGGRTTGNADQVIDVLNNAVTKGTADTSDDKIIVFLWGHNHTEATGNEKHYDTIYYPGYDIEYTSGSTKTTSFYYGAAGCMSDSEYSGSATSNGSANVLGKGLVVTVYKDRTLGFEYLDASGNDHTTIVSNEPIDVTGVSLNKSEMTLNPGKSSALTATIIPSGATNKNVSWSSSNTSVATVSDGIVTALAVGSTTITVTTEDGEFTATCAVTVSESATGTVSYLLTDTLEAGKDYVIANGNSGSVYLVSTEAGGSRELKGLAATVTGDTITLTEDEAEIVEFNCYLEDSSNANSTRLKNIKADKDLYTNNQNGLRMFTMTSDEATKWWHYRGDGKNLLWFFKGPDNDYGYTDTSGTYKYYLEWNSQGVFTDNHVTSPNLANSDLPKVYLFERVVDPVAVTGVSLDRTSETIYARNAFQLTATVVPQDATNKKVIWTTSNDTVATVDENGKVKGVAPGRATITVTTLDGGKHATCEVTVLRNTSVTTYIILIEDSQGAFALSNIPSQDQLTNTGSSSSQLYHYTGLSGVKYTGDVIENPPESILWIITQNRAGYTIQDLEGNYLNATYSSNNDGGYTGMLMVGENSDTWSFDGTLEDWEVNGAMLKSKNASDMAPSSSGDKFLSYESGTNGSINLFTVRSRDYADTSSVVQYELPDDGYVIMVTADPSDTAPNEEVDFTISIGPVEHLGTLQMELDIPDGLTYKAGSGKVADALKNLGMTDLEFSEGSLIINGSAFGSDIVTTEASTVIATFTCTVDDTFTSGSKDVGLGYLEFWSTEDPITNLTEYYSVIPAIVTVTKYTVTFNANEGSGTMVDLPAYKNVEAEVSANGFTREGYAFTGWNTKADGSGTAYMPGDSVAFTGDTVLYAQWEEVLVPVKITFKAEDGTTIAEKTVNQNTAWTDVEKPDAPVKQGYSFKEWAGAPETVTEDITVTASYTVNQYTITFDTDGGSEVAAITADYGAEITAPAAPTKTGYTFTGWTPALPATMPAENTTVKATWTVNQYTITFNTDGGSEVAAITADYGVEITAPAAPTKTGYTFGGWTPALPETMPADNLTVTATWTVNQYTITFETDGGSEVAAITADYGAAITAPAAPTKTGYTFAGWDPAFPETMPANNLTVTATWTANTYTVKFNKNDADATGEMASQSFTYDAEQELIANGFAKENYSFAGWATSADGEVAYSDGQSVRNLTAVSGGEVTLYAVWTQNAQVTITFNANAENVTGEMPAQTVYSNLLTQLNPNAFARTGYTFTGWATSADGEVVYADKASVTLSTDITLYAKWTVNEYTIKFVNEDGTVLQSGKVAYGATPTYTGETPTKAATAQYTYTFKEWTPAIAAVTEDATYTATFSSTVNKYTVTWKNDDGTVLETDKNVPYGTTPTYDGATPTKAATAQYTYTFKEWSPKVTAVKANTTYTATYTKTVNQYTVKFVDYDGTVLKKAVKYDYGTKWADVAKPADPTRAGYVFAGWTGYTNTVTKNITVKATYKAISYVMSNNITFEGALTFNAYTVISDDVLADDGAYMLITYTTAPTPTSARTVTTKVFVKNAKTSTKDGVTRRIFTVPFFIAQLNDEVTMKLYSSSGKEMPIGRLVSGEIVDMTKSGVVDTPWDYLNRIIDNPNSNPTMVELAKKSKIYGTAAQLHFNYHTEQVTAEAKTAMNKAIAESSIATALSKYNETTTGTLPAGISRYTKQIVFEADHSLKYFIYLDGTVDISKYTFEVDDGSGNFKKVTPVKVADGKYSIQKENIPSGYLSKKYSYRISDGTNTFVITSSGLAYANSIVTKNANPTMVDLVKAMYLYSVAAEKHFKISN